MSRNFIGASLDELYPGDTLKRKRANDLKRLRERGEIQDGLTNCQIGQRMRRDRERKEKVNQWEEGAKQ